MINELVSETIEATRETLTKAGLNANDLERIVFVGGPTNYKPLRDRVAFELSVPANIDVNPMTAVAEGASIFAESIDWSTDSHNRKAMNETISTDIDLSFIFTARTSTDKAKVMCVMGNKLKGYSIQFIKNMNESIFYNVDAVHQAINQNSKIRFQYFNYNIRAEREYKHGGKVYEESPYAMVCADDNYYLLAYNSERNIIKNYRVDKLAAVQVTGEPREGREVFEQYDLKRFTRNSFGMFSGKEAKVTMRFSHRFANAVVDRFGKDVFMRRVDDNWIEVVAPVVVSPMFFRWLYGLGAEAYIVGPQEVREAMKNHLLEVSKLYE